IVRLEEPLDGAVHLGFGTIGGDDDLEAAPGQRLAVGPGADVLHRVPSGVGEWNHHGYLRWALSHGTHCYRSEGCGPDPSPLAPRSRRRDLSHARLPGCPRRRGHRVHTLPTAGGVAREER